MDVVPDREFFVPSEDKTKYYMVLPGRLQDGFNAEVRLAIRSDSNSVQYAVRIQKFVVPAEGVQKVQAAKRMVLWRDLTKESEHLVKISDSVDDESHGTVVVRYTFMELSPIGDLFEFLKSTPGARFHESDALLMTFRIALCLESLHRRGVMHRDLKPENLVLFQNELGSFYPKMIDFDFLRPLPDNNGGPNLTLCIGTQRYMAPEVSNLNTIGFTEYYGLGVDMWALGCTLLHLLIGTHAFNTTIRSCLDVRASLFYHRSSMSASSFQLLDKVLQEDFTRRIDIYQFLNDALMVQCSQFDGVSVPRSTANPVPDVVH